MYLTNYTADKVKLAYTFVEHLRHNWRKLTDDKKDELLREISDLVNVTLVEQRYESKMNTQEVEKYVKRNKATRRAKLGA